MGTLPNTGGRGEWIEDHRVLRPDRRVRSVTFGALDPSGIRSRLESRCWVGDLVSTLLRTLSCQRQELGELPESDFTEAMLNRYSIRSGKRCSCECRPMSTILPVSDLMISTQTVPRLPFSSTRLTAQTDVEAYLFRWHDHDFAQALVIGLRIRAWTLWRRCFPVQLAKKA
jgi:hypothetical protein